jgi:hypothetical protein
MSFSHIGEWEEEGPPGSPAVPQAPDAADAAGAGTTAAPNASAFRRTLLHASSDDNVRAIGAALALCFFLWALKVGLIVWYILVKRINPLADAPVDGGLAFGGADLFICAVLAVVYRLMFAASRHGPRWWRYLLRSPATYAIHIAIVLFSVASFEVARIYGWPLEIEHLRTADDPRIIRSSIGAYAGLVPCTLIVLGILSRPLVCRPMESLLDRIRARRSARELWLLLFAATAILMALWTTRLRRIDTFGVKQNAIVYFIQHYQPAPGPIEVHATMKRLDSQLHAGDMNAGQAMSLVMPGQMLKPDFEFTGQAAAAARGMNVLVIQLESTSAAHLDEKTTPNLMRLAKNGLSFANHATVFAETTRATYGIYYSDYLVELGTTPRIIYGRRLPQTSLLEVARGAGYATAVFHSGFLSYGDQAYLFEDKGVDTVVDAQDLWKAHDGNAAAAKSLPWSWGVREEQTVDALTAWIKDHHKPQQPFFAVYATEFPHHPYVCPIDDKPFPETSWLNRYRNSLHYADKCIGTLLDRLGEMGLMEKTLIVVTGDHGETVSSYPVGHGLALTREEVFTPFILSNPKLFPSALNSKLTTNHMDIAPTVAHLAGWKAAPDWLGRDLLAEQIPARAMFVQTKLTQIQGVVDNGMLFVYEASRHRGQLFDTSAVATERIIHSDDLLLRYQALNETFQKWAIWHHLAEASQQLDLATSATEASSKTTTAPASVDRGTH